MRPGGRGTFRPDLANPLEARREKSVETGHPGLRVGPLARQRAQFAARRDKAVEPGKFRPADGAAADALIVLERPRNDVLAFLGFERAGAEHDGAAGFGEIDGTGQETPLHRRHHFDVVLRFSPGDIGMPPDGPGRGARRIDEHRIERVGLPVLRRRDHRLCFEVQSREIVVEPRHARFRSIDRGDIGARGGKLRGLAAGRSAQVGDRAAAQIAEQARRQRSGGVLHPPFAFGISRQRRDRTGGRDPHRAGRHDAALETLRPQLRIGFHREIERRLLAVGAGDGAGDLLAIGLGPPRQQPWRRIEIDRIEVRDGFLSDPRNAAEHGVDETGEARVAAIALYQPHRQIDGGVMRNVEEQELRCAGDQRTFDLRSIARQTAIKHLANEVA